MEARAERMGTVATTADILEAQQKEQKVSNTFFEKKGIYLKRNLKGLRDGRLTYDQYLHEIIFKH